MNPSTTDDVLDLLDATFTSSALGAALEKRLFWLLDRRPMDASGVALELGIPGARCRYWLRLLEEAGLLATTRGLYAPTPAARAAILDAFQAETWALLAEEARGRAPSLRDLPDHIATPGPVLPALERRRPSFYELMERDRALAGRFTRMLFDLHRELAAALAEALDLRGSRRLMDLGGGSGVIAMALLRRHQNLAAVVVDMAAVCEAGRELAKGSEVAERLSYHPADFLRGELPGGFDVVLECDVDVYDEALLPKVRAALDPGGRFVVVDQLAKSPGEAPPSRAHWAFHRSLAEPDFAYPSAGEVTERVERAGFRLVSERRLPPVGGRADRFTKGMLILEFRR